MSYLCFLAQASVLSQAFDMAFPKLAERYNLHTEDPSTKNHVLDMIRDQLWDRQRELRGGGIIGISTDFDTSLIRKLAKEIPEMYERILNDERGGQIT